MPSTHNPDACDLLQESSDFVRVVGATEVGGEIDVRERLPGWTWRSHLFVVHRRWGFAHRVDLDTTLHRRPARSPSVYPETLATIGRIEIRPATLDDADAVLDLLGEAAEWTASIGFPNWPARFPRDVVTRAISNGTLHVVELENTVVATVTLQWRDVMLWGEREENAGYVHRLAVRRDRAGEGLGESVVDWAAQQVRERDRDWLRLDASADNLRLCAYYERLGFEHCDDFDGEFRLPDGTVLRWRARLYERSCAVT